MIHTHRIPRTAASGRAPASYPPVAESPAVAPTVGAIASGTVPVAAATETSSAVAAAIPAFCCNLEIFSKSKCARVPFFPTPPPSSPNGPICLFDSGEKKIV